MPLDPQQREQAVAAVERLIEQHALGDTPSSEALVDAAWSVVHDAVLEPAQLYALSLDMVDREMATFSAAGGFTLTMHRGDWMERNRPSRIWITCVEGLEGL